MTTVLVVEPWLGGSHQSWANGFAAASSHDVSVVGLPAAAWRWRLRASSMALAELVTAHAARAGTPDLLLVSGLTDVAAFRGLLGAGFERAAPVVTFMHESQLLYPTEDGQIATEAAITNLVSWHASDEVWFNSEFHHNEVLAELPRFLSTVPTNVRPTADVTERFRVMGMGVDLTWVRPRPPRKPGPPRILWPHRWEADKNPDVFLAALKRLAGAGLEFELILAGEDGLKSSATKSEVVRRFAVPPEQVGPFTSERYRAMLASADLVVSCASHEFFGIAVVEAVAAGCVPILPNALSYPEVLDHPEAPPIALYPPGTFGSALESGVLAFDPTARSARLASAMTRHAWSNVAPRYDSRISQLATTIGV